MSFRLNLTIAFLIFALLFFSSCNKEEYTEAQLIYVQNSYHHSNYFGDVPPEFEGGSLYPITTESEFITFDTTTGGMFSEQGIDIDFSKYQLFVGRLHYRAMTGPGNVDKDWLVVNHKKEEIKFMVKINDYRGQGSSGVTMDHHHDVFFLIIPLEDIHYDINGQIKMDAKQSGFVPDTPLASHIIDYTK